MSRRIYIGNLPTWVTESILQPLLSELGTVVSLRLIFEGETGRFLGHGFVEMGSEAEAKTLCSYLQTHQMAGRNLTVKDAALRLVKKKAARKSHKKIAPPNPSPVVETVGS